MRHFMDNVHGKINEKLNGTFKGNLEERSVKTKSTDIQISIYTPIDAKKDKLGIFFHGGGWVSGNRQSHQVGVNFMADATKTIWISVEYRLAPEYKYPIWLDDCCDVTQYIIENKTSFGVGATAKVGVAGDSAGGMIAASIARTIKNLDFQIIIYGVLDMIQETESYKEFNKEMYFLTVDFMNWFISNAFESSQDLKDPRISGLFNTSLKDVPPCLFIVSELDVLRDGNLGIKNILL
ncbi:unnamed protein product [Adineta ricciae]|uniref:Alpha/beta hydrolase fold-3 domain-containing protein n=1 Tax=Adineta ricciae TaxID=249248 RepID=A0A816CA93_ADIRI|nr:unnamed protein product [Adineta ricciae]